LGEGRSRRHAGGTRRLIPSPDDPDKDREHGQKKKTGPEHQLMRRQRGTKFHEGGSGQVQRHQSEVDQLDANEGGKKATETVDEEIMPQQGRGR
jgi:hypothetical protein